MNTDNSNRSLGLPWPTRLADAFGVRYPFVGAGMGFVSMPRLVAAVSNAGGLGVLGNGAEPPDGTRQLIRQTRALTTCPFGVDFFVVTSSLGPATTEAHIEVAMEERVPLVVFHFNLPETRWIKRLRAAGVKIWMQTSSLEQVQGAVELGMDALVIQGRESGGHNKSRLPLREFLQKVRHALPSALLLAAGGIADGASAAAAFEHGADAVWVGTRLIATEEAHAHSEHKRRIVQAGPDSTVVTTLFGPELPDAPYRVLRNHAVANWGHARQRPASDMEPIGKTLLFPLTRRVPYVMPRFSAMVPDPEATGDFEQMGLPAGGESAGRIHSIRPAGELVRHIMQEAARRLGWSSKARLDPRESADRTPNPKKTSFFL